jgi:hypothetical protein
LIYSRRQSGMSEEQPHSSYHARTTANLGQRRRIGKCGPNLDVMELLK